VYSVHSPHDSTFEHHFDASRMVWRRPQRPADDTRRELARALVILLNHVDFSAGPNGRAVFAPVHVA
jgi:hypothetical protein